MRPKELVEAKTKVTEYNNALYAHMTKYSFQPGNGYKYEVLVVPVNKDLELGILGGIAQGSLVVNGFTGMSYLLSGSGSYLTCDYVADKFFWKDYAPDQHVNAVTALIAWILKRSSDATIEGMKIESPSMKEELDDFEKDMRHTAGLE